jgi:ABC-type transport system substrate-binding protein
MSRAFETRVTRSPPGLPIWRPWATGSTFENDGDKVYTFTIRDGHRWSDGQPFTAEDIRYWCFEDVGLQPQRLVVADEAGVAVGRDVADVPGLRDPRLVGYDETLGLKADILEKFENDGDKVYTFTIRAAAPRRPA